jgi:GntR family transcriptional regulator, transcriptional repressor for pyruvate dehydrogenase complex
MLYTEYMFKTVPREKTLTERVRQQLEDLIVSGSLKPGDQFPSESQVGGMLGVSRTVVREAMRLLSAKGLVEARDGSGIYVRELNSSLIRDPIDLLLRCRAIRVEDIVEVRAVIEVHLAGLAAQRATSEDIAAMEETIAQLHNDKLTPLQYAEIDIAFHTQLAIAAANPLFGILSQSITAVIVDPIRFEYERRNSARKDTIREHTRILDQVKARDAEGARQAMAESLVGAYDNWGGYLPQEPIVIPKLDRKSRDSWAPAGARKRSIQQVPPTTGSR